MVNKWDDTYVALCTIGKILCWVIVMWWWNKIILEQPIPCFMNIHCMDFCFKDYSFAFTEKQCFEHIRWAGSVQYTYAATGFALWIFAIQTLFMDWITSVGQEIGVGLNEYWGYRSGSVISLYMAHYRSPSNSIFIKFETSTHPLGYKNLT